MIHFPPSVGSRVGKFRLICCARGTLRPIGLIHEPIGHFIDEIRTVFAGTTFLVNAAPQLQHQKSIPMQIVARPRPLVRC